MKARVEEVFHAVADLSPEARERYFIDQSIGLETRHEVEALLAFDAKSGLSLAQNIGEFAEEVAASVELKDSRCGPYKLRNLLGRGGMGAVYAAERVDGEVVQRVAVKVLRPGADDQYSRQRFLAERQILATLSHPGIAGLLDAGHTTEGRPYLVMEHIDGVPIDVYAAKLDLRQTLALFVRVCEAVAYAHQNLIIHRDIKPANILVDPTGKPKLLDFGIAKLLEGDAHSGAATHLTRESGAALTPAYAAPEQVTGAPVTTATDVFALGVLLFVLLTGQHPAGPGPHHYAALLKAIVETEPPLMSAAVATAANGKADDSTVVAKLASPERLRKALQGDLDTIVAKALKKAPGERYASVAAMADDLRRYLRHEPIAARPDTFAYRSAKFIRRNRAAVALATLALVTSIAGVAGILMQAHTARVQRDFALGQLLRAEAMNDLNSFVLSDAAPSGRQFTVNELLGRAESIVRRGENDSTRVELLISIGRQYYAQDEDTRSRRVLDEAYSLSRKLSERSTRSKASCALASVLARSGEFTRGEQLIAEGLREVSGDRQFVLDRVYCLQRGSELAREHGMAQQALQRAEQARELILSSPFRSDLLDFHSLMQVAESYRVVGRYGESSNAFQRASALLSSLGRDNTETAGTLFNNWGLSLNALGRPQDAEKVLRRAIAISSSNDQEQGVSPMLMVNYARVLRDLARFDEAADYVDRGYQKAREAGDNVVINQSLLVRGSVYREKGDLRTAGESLSEAEPRLRGSLPKGHIAFASLEYEQALVAQARGDLLTARDLTNDALGIAESNLKSGREGNRYLAMLLARRSDIALRLGRLDDAVADAARGLEISQKLAQGVGSSATVGRAYLSLGRALRAQGKLDEARTALRSAAEQLQETLGPDHPDTRVSRQLANADAAGR